MEKGDLNAECRIDYNKLTVWLLRMNIFLSNGPKMNIRGKWQEAAYLLIIFHFCFLFVAFEFSTILKCIFVYKYIYIYIFISCLKQYKHWERGTLQAPHQIKPHFVPLLLVFILFCSILMCSLNHKCRLNDKFVVVLWNRLGELWQDNKAWKRNNISWFEFHEDYNRIWYKPKDYL